MPPARDASRPAVARWRRWSISRPAGNSPATWPTPSARPRITSCSPTASTAPGHRHLGARQPGPGAGEVHAQRSTGLKPEGRRAPLCPHRRFFSRYGNYIGLLPTGATRGEGDLPEYAGVKALAGLEASGTLRLLGQQGVWRGAGDAGDEQGASVLDLDWRADLARHQHQLQSAAAADRAGACGRHAALDRGAVGRRLGFDHSMAQHRVPEGGAHAGYALWNVSVTWRPKLGRSQLQWYARVDNLTNRRPTARLDPDADRLHRAPLPGRSLRVGMQATFGAVYAASGGHRAFTRTALSFCCRPVNLDLGATCCQKCGRPHRGAGRM